MIRWYAATLSIPVLQYCLKANCSLYCQLLFPAISNLIVEFIIKIKIMTSFKKIPGLLYHAILLCFFILSCNNASERSVDEYTTVDSTATTSGDEVMDTANTANVAVDSIQDDRLPDNSTGSDIPITTVRPAPLPAIREGDDRVGSTEPSPKASIAYAYKNKMKKGDNELVQMHVQLNKPLENVRSGLRNSLDEQKAIETGSSDTSIIKSLSIAGDKYFLVSIKYDTAVFFIERIFGEEKQELKFNKPNKWIWRVTAKRETTKSEIFIIVRSEDAAGNMHESDVSILPIQISVAIPMGSANSRASFFTKYGWLLFSAAVVILLLFFISLWRKRKRLQELNSRIYFSYAWNEEKDTIIDKLYMSLEKDGFNVIRDKVDLKYKGLISNFMKDIGKGNIIIIAISDKYLKSRFCMFELYEIYRNCGMSKEEFVKKVFPIRQEEINLSDAVVIDHYIDHWNEEELKLEALVKDTSQETTSEQFAQYDAIRRIESELGNLLHFLSDINSLNIELL